MQLRSEPIEFYIDGARFVGTHLTHEPEPCEFVEGRCACGRIDLGVVSGDAGGDGDVDIDVAGDVDVDDDVDVGDDVVAVGDTGDGVDVGGSPYRRATLPTPQETVL